MRKRTVKLWRLNVHRRGDKDADRRPKPLIFLCREGSNVDAEFTDHGNTLGRKRNAARHEAMQLLARGPQSNAWRLPTCGRVSTRRREP
jgi:hypothetical protein